MRPVTDEDGVYRAVAVVDGEEVPLYQRLQRMEQRIEQLEHRLEALYDSLVDHISRSSD